MMVKAPTHEGGWIKVSTKEGIEQACLEENMHHFSQASNTPFLQPPLAAQVGQIGIGPGATAILDGMFHVPNGTDEWAVKLIPHLA